MMTFKIALRWDEKRSIPKALGEHLSRLIDVVPEHQADILVVCGGDGYMLHVLHHLLDVGLFIPVYGLNCGTVGFLMNPADMAHPSFQTKQAFLTLLDNAHELSLPALELNVETLSDGWKTLHAFNEVVLHRMTAQTAHIKICVDGHARVDTLVGDGLLVATPAGSTAYNFSAHGPILPLGANVMALTPINPYQPRLWRGAILPKMAQVTCDVRFPEHRRVSATADFQEIPDIIYANIRKSPDRIQILKFNRDDHLESRILKQQFMA